jgi:putative phage-type endonuclease
MNTFPRKVKLGKGKYKDKREYIIPRETGIGSADVADVFSLPPYGCARRLYYQKTGSPPDYVYDKNETNYHIRRGNMFEKLAAEQYIKMTGRKAFKPNRAFRSDYHPFMIAHIDWLIQNKGAGRKASACPLELKNPSKQHYLKIKHEGIPDYWILQLQHQMYVKEAPWGAFGVMSPEMAQMLPSFDLERDENLINKIVRVEGLMWEAIQERKPPEKLPIEDKRCATCDWRITCHGELGEFLEKESDWVYIEDKDFQELTKTYLELKGEIDEKTETLGMLKDTIQKKTAEYEGKARFKTDWMKIYNLEFKQARWDMAKLKTEHPELEKDYKKINQVRMFKLVAINEK